MSNTEDISNYIQNSIASAFDKQYRRVEPQPNILDDYSSYTYNISIYMLSAADYREMVTLKRPVLKGSNLLITTGGTPDGPEYRNQRFPLDFFIDEIRIQQAQPGRGSRGANGIISLNFKIIEPNGITFLDNLYHAVDDLVGGKADPNRKENYSAQTYLMHIKFFGYNHNGDLAPPVVSRENDIVTDNRSIAEKFIPFRFTNITYRIVNNAVEYQCTAAVPQNDIGTGQGRGVIPYNVELTASTLAEAFAGGASLPSNSNSDGRESQAPASAAPPKANSSKTGAVAVNSLVSALNGYQIELTKPQAPLNETIYDEYDEYEVIFTDPVLANATTQPPGPTPKDQVSANRPLDVSSRLLGYKQFANNETKTISAVAGTTLVQFLDQVIRSSSFIYDQQTKGFDADGNLVRMSTDKTGLVAWYRIGVQVVPKAYDRKRNDYAYKITYQVSPYLINDVKSPYFPETKFRGVHKAYDYWFTGKNNAIISYQQDFNYSYYTVISGPQPSLPIANFREYEKQLYQPRSNEADHGQGSRINEPAANLASRQYNAADLARIRMTIIGDPAWIHQGEVWSGIAGNAFSVAPFLADGTINVEAEEPLFQISWNKPSDYDLNTGVTDPSGRQFGGGNQLLTGDNGASQVNVYRAITVTSNFSKGQFTQDIEGVIVTFPDLAVSYNRNREIDTLKNKTDSLGSAIDDTDDTLRSDNGTGGFAGQGGSTGGRGATGTWDNESSSGNANGNATGTAESDTSNTSADAKNSGADSGTLAEAKPPQPPTSNGQDVSNPMQEVTTTTFDIGKLTERNPELANEFKEYVRNETARRTEERMEQINATENLTRGEASQLRQAARIKAAHEADEAAINKFAPRLKELGPDVFEVSTKVTGAGAPTAADSTKREEPGNKVPVVRESKLTLNIRDY